MFVLVDLACHPPVLSLEEAADTKRFHVEVAGGTDRALVFGALVDAAATRTCWRRSAIRPLDVRSDRVGGVVQPALAAGIVEHRREVRVPARIGLGGGEAAKGIDGDPGVVSFESSGGGVDESTEHQRPVGAASYLDVEAQGVGRFLERENRRGECEMDED